MIVSAGRMIGDYDIIKNTPCQMSLVCYSPEAEVKVIEKKEFLNLQ